MNLLVELGKIDAQTWITVGIVAGIVSLIAILIVVAILVVSKVFKVDTDEKMSLILDRLAGANCGGCGCSGCSGFACKLATGEAKLDDCHVTSDEQKQEIANILGIKMEKTERTVAVVNCNGGENAGTAFEYSGNLTCAYKNSLLGGDKVCKFGCLGCGDCATVCPEHCIKIENGVAKIDANACISCGTCILTCPKNIISRIPASAPVYVACSSHCKGKEVMGACKVGCIACGLCAKKCPQNAITMIDNLPVIDYEKCNGCKTCVGVCPRHTIIERY